MWKTFRNFVANFFHKRMNLFQNCVQNYKKNFDTANNSRKKVIKISRN